MSRSPFPLQWPAGRAMIKTAHPDYAQGGHMRAVELNTALAEAEKELGK